jgi:hypothetical protein
VVAGRKPQVGSPTSENRRIRGYYFLNEQLTMDSVKVWHTFKEQFNGDNNVLLKSMKHLKILDRTFSPGISGGAMGYIDQILHKLNQLDIFGPKFYHHYSMNN